MHGTNSITTFGSPTVLWILDTWGSTLSLSPRLSLMMLNHSLNWKVMLLNVCKLISGEVMPKQLLADWSPVHSFSRRIPIMSPRTAFMVWSIAPCICYWTDPVWCRLDSLSISWWISGVALAWPLLSGTFDRPFLAIFHDNRAAPKGFRDTDVDHERGHNVDDPGIYIQGGEIDHWPFFQIGKNDDLLVLGSRLRRIPHQWLPTSFSNRRIDWR